MRRCCDYHAGMLRHRITVQAAVPTPDDMGGYAETWATVATMPARVTPVSGGETYYGQRVEAHVTHTITTRYMALIKPPCRIIFEGRIFAISAVIDIEERHRWLEIRAVEGRGNV
jgi:SPP1 family predicted phage head-tail adaptor